MVVPRVQAAKAMAASYTSGSAAIGASIATVYSDRSQIASVGAGNSIAATDVSVTSINREVDGTFDQATRRAIRRYQSNREIEASGYLDEATVVRLLADSVQGIVDQ